MHIYYISLIATSLSALFLGIYVYLKNTKSNINKTWLFTSLSVAIWSCGFVTYLFLNDYQFALFYARVSNVSAVFIPLFLLHFSLALTSRNIIKNKFLIFGYLFATFILVFGFNDYFIPYVRPVANFNYYAAPGPIYPFFNIFFIFYACYAEYTLIKGFKHAVDPIKRNQLKYVILGTSAGFIFGSTTFLCIYGINIDPWPVHFTFVYNIIVAYAIIKHNLMDINVVIKKGLVYSSLITILTVTYLLVVLLAERFSSHFFGYTTLPMTIVTASIIAIAFIPLRNKIQYIVDHLLFKGTLDSLAQERELMHQELMRSERLRAVATLAAGMAHEIKNPLTAIKTFTEHLKEKKDDPEFISKFERIVGGEVDKINSLVHSLLDFARPNPLKIGSVDLQSILEDTLVLLSDKLLARKISVNKKYSTLPPIQADHNQLKQAFLNLMLNAIEAMPNGGKLTLDTSISKTYQIEVIISDTGGGIPKKELPHIFDPFYSTKDTGTGLGLSITHEIIKKHNGTISVESEAGRGTVVRIKL